MRTQNIVLVYQAGIANVFRVERITENSARRGLVERLLQTDFRTAEAFCRGMQATKVCDVASMHCNQAGDIASQTWSLHLADAPFREQMRPVGWYE